MAGGGKGGVGKSMVSMAVTDYLASRGETVVLIDTDTSNPDVWKAYKDAVKCELVDLDEADGWIQLVNLCDENQDATVIVNTAARNNRGVTAYGTTLNSTLDELKRQLVTLWVINRQRDSVELLKEFADAIPAARIHVLRNSYYGDENQFELYNGSKTRKLVEQRGGLSVNFPEVADRVADDLYTKRLDIGKAARELPIGNRAELTRWRNACRALFDTIL